VKTPLRIALVALPLFALLWAATNGTQVQRQKEQLLELDSVESTVVGADLQRRIDSEIDPAVAALVIARSAVAAYLDPERRLAAAAGATQESTLDALRAAQLLSSQTLAERPTNWQASMLLGATTYLIRLRERDTRLFSRAQEWEAPLEAAHTLAPGQIEPRRFLAAAYLDTWPALSPQKRETAREIVRSVLRDRESFRLLIAAWMRVSQESSFEEDNSFGLIPEEPWAWSYLLESLASLRDWERYSIARDRWHAALSKSLEATVLEARERLQGGDIEGARTLLTSVVSQTPLGTEYAELFGRALSQLPPGPVARIAERRLRNWFDWSLTQCQVIDCPLQPQILARLGGAVRDALPHEAALAALAAGDRSEAEAIERRNRVVLEEAWADYLLFKAARLLDANDPAGATTTLAAVHRSRRMSERFHRVAARLQAIGSEAGDRTDAEISGTTQTFWAPSAWEESAVGLSLEVATDRPARGIELTIPASSSSGGAVDVRWNGERLGTFVAGGKTSVEIGVDVRPGLHLLEISPIIGARPKPGSARLLPLGNTPS